MTRIYTRKGDDGTTALFDGKRVKKNDPLIHVLGELDSCNASIGMALAFFPEGFLPEQQQQLSEIQNALFDLGASIAAPERSNGGHARFNVSGIKNLESWIDGMEAKLPALHAFILPGGSSISAALHVARCMCRQAERFLAALDLSEGMVYLNRLSDYLFVVARFVNHSTQKKDILWKQAPP